MRGLRASAAAAAMAIGFLAHGQSAVRVIAPYNYLGGFRDLPYRAIPFGLGYDHDLNKRQAYGIDLIYMDMNESRDYTRRAPDMYTLELHYRSSYSTTDNESTAFYLGSWLGVRRTAYSMGKEEGTTMSVPLGLRFGVRGGLEGFFMDLYAAFGCNLGGQVPTTAYGAEGSRMASLSGPEIRVGLSFGVGWDKRGGR